MNTVVPVLFGLGIAMGLWMAVRHFQGETSPAAWGLLHGALNLSGIGLLALIISDLEPQQLGLIALGVAGLTALGGIYLGWRQHEGEPWPAAVILAHGAGGLTVLALVVVWLATAVPGM